MLLSRAGLPAPPHPTNQNTDSCVLAAARWLSLEGGSWVNGPGEIIHSELPFWSGCFIFGSSCRLISQVYSRPQSVQFLPLHRVRELADRLGLRQHPRPRPLPSTSGLVWLVLVLNDGRSLRPSSALQFPGGRVCRTNVSSPEPGS